MKSSLGWGLLCSFWEVLVAKKSKVESIWMCSGMRLEHLVWLCSAGSRRGCAALGSLKHPKRYSSYLAKRSTWSRKMCFLSRAQFTKLLATTVNMPFCKLGAERYLEPLNSKINHCCMAWFKIYIIDNNCYYNLVFIWTYHKGWENNDNNHYELLKQGGKCHIILII